jgi:oligopeptide transport system substrate-binding protein
MRSKVYVFTALLILVSMILGACQQAPAATPETIIQTVIVEGTPQIIEITATPAPTEPPAPEAKVLTLNMGPGDIPTLDPSVAEDTSSNQIIALTTVGLYKQNEVTTALEPGIAESYTSEVNADGEEVVTFKLRPDIAWVRYNGTEVEQVLDCEGAPRTVKAQDFVYGAQRTLLPATGSPYAYVLSVVKGAADFNNGVTEDFATVGITAPDDMTVQFVFTKPAAYNVNIVSLWVVRAQPSWLIDGDDCTEARGDRWTETGFNQSYGPYALKEWVHDSYITLTKNPFWAGIESAPAPMIEEVTWTMLDEAPAFAEYEAGNIDVAAVPLADIDRVKADPTLSAEMVTGPVLCTYYYGFNTKAPNVDNVHLRRALSLAFDRQALIDNVLKAGQEPAQWFSRPGLAGAPTIEEYPDLGVKFDPAKAKEELDAYFADTGETLESLQGQVSLFFNTSSGHQKIAEAAQAFWKDNLGLDVQLVNQEWKVYLETVKSTETPQIWRLGWCQDYPDANNFIAENFVPNGSSNPADEAGEPFGGVNWKNDQFIQLVTDAAVETDLAKRVELYAQAEEILVWEDAAIIPIYWYTRLSVTKPYVTRTFSVLGGMEAIEKWDINK